MTTRKRYALLVVAWIVAAVGVAIALNAIEELANEPAADLARGLILFAAGARLMIWANE